VRRRFARAQADDRVVCKRVRAELGRVASHPRALCVTVRNGHVTLSGDVLEAEAPSIVSKVRHVRGVATLESLMIPHESAGDIPWLQGESERPEWWSTWLRSSWSPTAVTAAVAAGAVVAIVAISQAHGDGSTVSAVHA
jgi:hypothetical protein